MIARRGAHKCIERPRPFAEESASGRLSTKHNSRARKALHPRRRCFTAETSAQASRANMPAEDLM